MRQPEFMQGRRRRASIVGKWTEFPLSQRPPDFVWSCSYSGWRISRWELGVSRQVNYLWFTNEQHWAPIIVWEPWLYVQGQAVRWHWGEVKVVRLPWGYCLLLPSKVIATGRVQEEMQSEVNCRILATSLWWLDFKSWAKAIPPVLIRVILLVLLKIKGN